MVKLNLETKNVEQEKILNYLQNNVSNILADKINNGVYMEKDGKRLLNKKDLDNFINNFASEEALKFIAESERKGRKTLCIDDPTVYGWAVHYFEEDSIEGTLYNEDGTVYKKAMPTPPKTTVTSTKVISKTKKNDGQVSIFDMNFDDEVEQDNVDEVETPPSCTKQATVIDTPAPKVTEQRQVTTSNGCSQQELFWYKYELIQKQHPNSILFYRLGDFYEALDKSAEIASQVLNLTLTGKNCGTVGRLPMCGVPYHAVDVYVNKLRNKYDVVLMHSDQELQESPKKDFADIVQENADKIDKLAEKYDIANETDIVVDEDIDKEIDRLSCNELNKYFGKMDDLTDKTTGEIKVPNIDKELFEILYSLFDGQVIMR